MQFRTDCNQTTSSKWDNAYEQHEDDWDQKAEDNGTGMNRKKRRGRNTASVSKDAAIDTDNTHAKTIGDVNPFVTSPGDLRDLGRPFRYEPRRSPGLITWDNYDVIK